MSFCKRLARASRLRRMVSDIEKKGPEGGW